MKTDTPVKRVAVIPARGGSKRIPGKNIRLFCGKPMIAYSIEAALQSGLFDVVAVSTDSEAIASVAREYRAEVPFMRPAELANDFVGTDEVFLHAIQALQEKIGPIGQACCIYATAPMVRSEDLREGWNVLTRTGAATAFSVTNFGYPVFRALRINDRQRLAMMWPENQNSRSQDLPELWHDAGQFYWVDVARYTVERRLFSVDAAPVILPRWRVQDIDTEEDWQRAELMFRAHSPEFQPAWGVDESGLQADGKGDPVVRHSRPSITEDEISAVMSVMRSGHVAQGPRVDELEGAWCARTGTSASVAVGSGLAALRLAFLAMGVRSGDEVIVPAYSGAAIMNAVLSLGAVPVLTDVLSGRWTLSPDDAKRRMTKRTRVIVAVHLFGMPAPMREILSLGVPVLEDCAHGIGGVCCGKPFGGLGLLSISSFYATKMLAGGEGGIVAGYDASMLDRVRKARDYGDQAPDGRHLNDKMTDIEAAMTLTQLRRLAGMLVERQRLAQAYNEWLRPLETEGFLQLPLDALGRIWYRYAVRLCSHKAEDLVARMAEHGVRAEQPVWDLRRTPVWHNDCPATTEAFDRVLSLPLYPGLSEFDQHRVCVSLDKGLRA